eukprot:2499526-Prorocentrum_lima.AAC.1
MAMPRPRSVSTPSKIGVAWFAKVCTWISVPSKSGTSRGTVARELSCSPPANVNLMALSSTLTA